MTLVYGTVGICAAMRLLISPSLLQVSNDLTSAQETVLRIHPPRQGDNQGGRPSGESLKDAVQAVIAFIGCPILAFLAVCQDITATILGTVCDSSRAVIPPAQVTLTEVSTNQEREISTDQLGYYEVPYLKPETYYVSVSAPGFETAIERGI
jgi:hypothetical protein